MDERTWIEVDLKALEHNFKLIRTKVGSTKICPVIKDNAYGHGSVELAKLYETLGADYFAVSNIEEALILRNNQISKPILILGYTPISLVKELVEFNITQCVYSLEYATLLNDCGLKIKCHLKVDTGMNRIGFKDIDEMEQVYHLVNLDFEGIFTHFAKADDESFTDQQFNLFVNTIKELEKRNCHFAIRHCANSYALFNYDKYHLDMVRPGILLYGLEGYKGLKQAMQLKSVITEVKTIEKGETVGYDCRFKADGPTKVATVAIGYGDGYFRANGGLNCVLVNNHLCPIIGNVCMDQLMIRVDDVPCKLGDEVLMYPDLALCAKNLNTISYELICAIDSRVKIIYQK